MGQAAVLNESDLERLQERVRDDVRLLTGATLQRGASRPDARTTGTSQREGYRLESLELKLRDAVLTGVLALPDTRGRKPATLLLTDSPLDEVTVPGGDLDLLARDGTVVMAFEPRAPVEPPGPPPPVDPERADPAPVRTTLGRRVDDAIRAVAWLRGHGAVDRAITIHGIGPHSLVALHAAVLLRDHVARIVVEDLPVSYRIAVDRPDHPALGGMMIPGVPGRYDVADLLLATFPQRIAIVKPVDVSGERATELVFASALSRVFRSERNLRRENDGVARIAVLFVPR